METIVNPIPSWVVVVLALLAASRWLYKTINTKDVSHVSTMLIRLWGAVLYGFLSSDEFLHPEIARWSFLARLWIVAFLVDENAHWILPMFKFIGMPRFKNWLRYRNGEHPEHRVLDNNLGLGLDERSLALHEYLVQEIQRTAGERAGARRNVEGV